MSIAMDPTWKVKWVEALRSGKYKQAREHLRTSAGFCCLGVLCDLAGVEWRPDALDGIPEAYLGDVALGVNGKLTFEGRRMFGIHPHIMDDLIHMNDGQFEHPPQSFDQIANYVEASL